MGSNVKMNFKLGVAVYINIWQRELQNKKITRNKRDAIK